MRLPLFVLRPLLAVVNRVCVLLGADKLPDERCPRCGAHYEVHAYTPGDEVHDHNTCERCGFVLWASDREQRVYLRR